MSQKDIVIVGVIAILAVVVIVFGSIDLATWVNRNKYSSPNTVCPAFPANLTSFSATKVWPKWKWTYGFDDFAGSIEQVCPSATNDVNVYLDGQLAARTDGKIASTVSTMYINDCTGNTIYVVRTGDMFDTIINGLNIKVSFELRDVNGTILAYTQGTYLFTDTIDVKDAITGNIVAHLSRDLITLLYKWDFTIYDASAPGADPRVLSVLAGKRSFTDGNKTDSCNQFFLATGIICIILLCVGFIAAAVRLYYCFKGQC